MLSDPQKEQLQDQRRRLVLSMGQVRAETLKDMAQEHRRALEKLRAELIARGGKAIEDANAQQESALREFEARNSPVVKGGTGNARGESVEAIESSLMREYPKDLQRILTGGDISA